MKQSNHSEHFENDVVNYRQKTGPCKIQLSKTSSLCHDPTDIKASDD